MVRSEESSITNGELLSLTNTVKCLLKHIQLYIEINSFAANLSLNIFWRSILYNVLATSLFMSPIYDF
jgi:hypothetical protein